MLPSGAEQSYRSAFSLGFPSPGERSKSAESAARQQFEPLALPTLQPPWAWHTALDFGVAREAITRG